MKRFDPIAVIALILALVALLLILMRPSPEPGPQTESEPVPGFDWVSHGLLALEPVGDACAVRLQFPTRIEARPGDRIEWDIYNRCEEPVTLSAGPREAVEGNRSDEEDPFVRVSDATVPPGGKGRVLAQIKDEDALTNPDDEQASDTWRFRWQANGQAQEDPEIEIEYRRARR